MANVSHASLTGSNLHEPKGISSASSGTVYIADGAGSGAWTSSNAIATGMVADFCTPIAPTGWLELDGTDISTTTFSTLYSVMTIQQTGSRGGGSAIITGLSSTANMKAGYFVFGTGITSGTTVLSVNSSTQITMSANAASGGTATVIVSPWLLNTGTIRLPNTKTAGRFRRSRSTSIQIGTSQTDLLKNHTHTTTTGNESTEHTHSFTTNFADQSLDHTHFYQGPGLVPQTGTLAQNQIYPTTSTATSFSSTAGYDLTSHTHSGSTGSELVFHTHTGTSGNPDSAQGGAETRPLTLVFMTCVKT